MWVSAVAFVEVLSFVFDCITRCAVVGLVLRYFWISNFTFDGYICGMRQQMFIASLDLNLPIFELTRQQVGWFEITTVLSYRYFSIDCAYHKSKILLPNLPK